MGISLWQILIVLAIIILLFGTSKLRNVGTDLGSALKGFKRAMQDEDKNDDKDEKKDADFEPLEKPVTKTDESAKVKSADTTSHKHNNKD